MALILCMAAVTALCRLLPAILLSDRELPAGFKNFLHLAPPAIISAMIAPPLFFYKGSFSLAPANHSLWIGLFCLTLALRTRNIAWTVLAGVALKAVFP